MPILSENTILLPPTENIHWIKDDCANSNIGIPMEIYCDQK